LQPWIVPYFLKKKKIIIADAFDETWQQLMKPFAGKI
jgi:hypothetical protein